MCGFTCLIEPGRPFSQSLIAQIDKDLFHRGPDSGGVISETGAAMVFRRLAIMDPSAVSDQPMSDRATDTTLVFNGEIYNFRALREELRAKGAQFQTNGDTEVILRGYAVWGEGVFDRLEGMFTIGLIDRKRGKFLAVRDPLGIKPLYLLNKGSLTAVSSEIRPLTRLVPAEVDPDVVPELLTFHWAAGRRSNYRGIERVPGGTIVSVNLTTGAMSERRYCDPLDTLRVEKTSTAQEAQHAVEESLKAHLMSDVGYAMQLSGGVDSSLLTALASQSAAQPLSSFAVQVVDSRYDEGEYRKLVTDRFDLHHVEDPVDGETYADLLPHAIEAMEGPVPHGGCVTLFGLCKSIQKTHKVVLTGEGADEMFGGYLRYQIADKLARQDAVDKMLPSWLPLPDVWPFKGIRKLRGLDKAVFASVYGDFENLCGLFPGILPPAPGARGAAAAGFDDFLSRLFAVDQTAYLESLLVRQDKMSMANSVEARVPFVHMPLLRCVNALPHSVRAPGGTTKPVLKELAERYLPRDVIHRRKVGLLLPYDRWIGEDRALGRYLTLLEDTNARIRQYADGKRLNMLLSNVRAGTHPRIGDVFKLINLELWLQSVRADTVCT